MVVADLYFFTGGKMIIPKSLLLLFVLVFAILLGACTKNETDSQDKHKAGISGQPNGAESTTPGLINGIKRGKLVNYQSATIGTAFDSYKYLTNKEWKLEQQNRYFIVDFVGWFESDTLTENDIKAGVTGKGLDVKFVVEPNGSYYVFMVSKLEAKADGKVYGSELKNSTDILTNIYANKKISL